MIKECSICGKKLNIILDKNGVIIKGGCFWNFREGEPSFEYWECENCYSEETDNPD